MQIGQSGTLHSHTSTQSTATQSTKACASGSTTVPGACAAMALRRGVGWSGSLDTAASRHVPGAAASRHPCRRMPRAGLVQVITGVDIIHDDSRCYRIHHYSRQPSRSPPSVHCAMSGSDVQPYHRAAADLHIECPDAIGWLARGLLRVVPLCSMVLLQVVPWVVHGGTGRYASTTRPRWLLVLEYMNHDSEYSDTRSTDQSTPARDRSTVYYLLYRGAFVRKRDQGSSR